MADTGIVVQQNTASAPVDHWVKRSHPFHADVERIHARRWALYGGRREDLFPQYLEAHRLEARDETGVAGVSIYRKNIGYAPRLAQGLIADIIGHLGATKKTYAWGALSDGAGGGDDKLPTGRAKRLMDDATKDGRDWETFFGVDVLEQILATKGGLLIIDAPRRDANAPAPTIEEAQQKGIRPYVRLIDWSLVVDWRWGENGLEWVKLLEQRDTRTLRDSDNTNYKTESYLVYEFTADGQGAQVTRYDTNGKESEPPRLLTPVFDMDGRPTLPLLPAVFAPERRGVAPLGRGLLDGLDDIEIDLANQLNELRDEVRTIVFGLLTYKGNNGAGVEENLKKNSRFIDLGVDGVMSYVAASGEVITQLLAVIDRTYSSWRAAVRQKPAELMDSTSARSGTSFASEFAVSWKPLLGGVAQTLDDIETNALFLLGQFWGLSREEAATLKVTRDKQFRLEDEGSFLAKSIADITKATDTFPAMPMARLIVAMMEAFNAVTDEDDPDALIQEVVQALMDKRSADQFMSSLRNTPPDGGAPDGGAGGEAVPPGTPAKPGAIAPPKPKPKPKPVAA